MGRELKRVPLDFEWPLNKLWKGYINPHNEACGFCKGRGETVAMQRLSDLVALLMLSGEDAARGQCHPFFRNDLLYRSQGATCGPDMSELTTGLAGRKPSSFLGHDAVDQWEAIRKIIHAAGMPDDWGTCQACNGHGMPPDVYVKHEAWTGTEPPEGQGYQIWETVSEGSPISPVFEDPEQLAEYMATKEGSKEAWLLLIHGDGWAPSMAMDQHGLHVGVNSLLAMQRHADTNKERES